MTLLRRLAAFALLVAIPCAAVGPARADQYPSRSIRVIVPFGAGGVTDTVSRIVFEAMSANLGQSMVVENKAGASGTIGTEFVAEAAPDGHTLLANDPSGPMATNVSLYPSRRFDPVARLTPIALMGRTGAVLVVSTQLGVKTVAEFVALAKQKPGELTYASTGSGTPGHLNVELFKRLVGIDATHVPYRLGTQAMTDLLSGRIGFWIIPLPSALKQIETGNLRVLAVAGESRLPELPDVPTVKEAGFGDYDVSTVYALFAPAGTSPEIVGKLARATDTVLKIGAVRERLARVGVQAESGSAERVAAILKQKIPQWREVIESAGIKGN